MLRAHATHLNEIALESNSSWSPRAFAMLRVGGDARTGRPYAVHRTVHTPLRERAGEKEREHPHAREGARNDSGLGFWVVLPGTIICHLL